MGCRVNRYKKNNEPLVCQKRSDIIHQSLCSGSGGNVLLRLSERCCKMSPFIKSLNSRGPLGEIKWSNRALSAVSLRHFFSHSFGTFFWSYCWLQTTVWYFYVILLTIRKLEYCQLCVCVRVCVCGQEIIFYTFHALMWSRLYSCLWTRLITFEG